MKRGLYVGRFQPLHLGHIEMIRFALTQKDIDELIIVIGSAEKNHTLDNPFTAGERLQMLYSALYWEQLTSEGDSMLDFCKIIQVNDSHNNASWVSTIESYAPKFDVVFTNEPISKRLFKEAGYEIRGKICGNRKVLSGTIVRNMMINGVDVTRDSSGKICKVNYCCDGSGNFEYTDYWKELVPNQVVEWIEEFDGLNRIRELAQKDC